MNLVADITVNYVDNDSGSQFYNPIPTEGMVSGNLCFDKSTSDWYEFNGTNWDIKYVNALYPISSQLIDIRFSAGTNILFDAISAQYLDLRYPSNDTTIVKNCSACLDTDINRVVKKFNRFFDD